jgi:hypothetical protein
MEMKKWSELRPEGMFIYYEGDDCCASFSKRRKV